MGKSTALLVLRHWKHIGHEPIDGWAIFDDKEHKEYRVWNDYEFPPIAYVFDYNLNFLRIA